MNDQRICLCLLLGLIAGGALAQGDDPDWDERKKVVSQIFQQAYDDDLPADAADAPAFDPTDPDSRPDPDQVAAAIQQAIIELFSSYEREDVGGFTAQVHPSFTSRDDLSNDYRMADLIRALQDDFDVLDRIDFTVNVGQPIVQADGRRAQVEVRWSRRAWVQIGGQEWIVQNQRTVFLFEYSPNPGWKIVRIFGVGIFAVSNRLGQIIVREGTIDGVVVTDPILLDKIVGIIKMDDPPPAFVAPITGTFKFCYGLIDFDLQLLDTSCEGTGPFDIDFACGQPEIVPSSGKAKEITGLFSSIDDVTEVPAPPYGSAAFPLLGPDVGRLFAVQTDQGKFAIFQITAAEFIPSGPPLVREQDCASDGDEVPVEVGCCGFVEYTIRFKYQTDGTRKFKP